MTEESGKYLRAGWHEFLVPTVSERGTTEYLRTWIDMADLVPMLRHLDLIYGDREHPYAMNVAEIPDVQRHLLRMVAQHLLASPEAIRRAAVRRRFAEELWSRFQIAPSPRGLPYPPVIDQVDLDPQQVGVALPFILDRSILEK